MAEAAYKPDKDFTKEVDEQIPQAELLAKVCSHYKPKTCVTLIDGDLLPDQPARCY